jgi:hypothetical protein
VSHVRRRALSNITMCLAFGVLVQYPEGGREGFQHGDGVLYCIGGEEKSGLLNQSSSVRSPVEDFAKASPL